ncbi:hypothetical protein MTR62_18570 [Novosphingobium sp. 1949]|uniref:Uncharacterized protein n=1 Tax=Novosphingobium organovorum TaxID=2930092 RepID=A0ABT0BHY7_9SPHN|nr:hypothetical protein [Novosphingobium organovorum]MCJ2184677.1 hypothetical protein [Novosphingobium organovorum]
MPAVDAAPSAPVAIAAPRVVGQSDTGTFDLGKLDNPERTIDLSSVQRRCRPASDRREIVVCAPDPDAQRLGRSDGFKGLENRDNGPWQAQWGLTDSLALGTRLEAATMPDGTISNRVMVDLKIKF